MLQGGARPIVNIFGAEFRFPSRCRPEIAVRQRGGGGDDAFERQVLCFNLTVVTRRTTDPAPVAALTVAFSFAHSFYGLHWFSLT